MGAFSETKKYFEHFTRYNKPMSFEAWAKLDLEFKAAVLYLQFYKVIYKAYTKNKISVTDECECVEVVVQHLIKNVPKILESPERFTDSYIYKVACNCISSVCYIRLRDKLRNELEQSNIVYNEDGTYYDVFDFVGDDEDVCDFLEKEALWQDVYKLNELQLRILEHLMYGRKLNQELVLKFDDILSELKTIFKKYNEK